MKMLNFHSCKVEVEGFRESFGLMDLTQGLSRIISR